MDQDLAGSMGVRCDTKAQVFLAKQKNSEFLLDVEFTEEPCVQIYTPVFRIFTESSEKFHTLVHTQAITLYISSTFIDLFSLPPTLEVSVEGLLRKRLIVKNIDPIIKNVCKIQDVK